MGNEAKQPEPILVKAKRKGVYGGRRRTEGEMFYIESEKHFSDANRKAPFSGWMVKVLRVPEDFEEREGYVPLPRDGRKLTFPSGPESSVPDSHVRALAAQQGKSIVIPPLTREEDKDATPTGDARVI